MAQTISKQILRLCKKLHMQGAQVFWTRGHTVLYAERPKSECNAADGLFSKPSNLKKILLLVLAAMIWALPAVADMSANRAVLEDAKANIEKAYYTDNKKDLHSQIERLRPFAKKNDLGWYAHYYIAFCHNHLALLDLDTNKKQASANVKAAFAHVKQALKIRSSAELYVLKTSLMGKKIELGKTVMRLSRGIKAKKYIEKAKKIAPNMPGVIFEDAHVILHTPKKLGGGPQKAKKLLLKALKILENYELPDPLLLCWHLKADTLAWLAFMEIEIGNRHAAKKYLDKALALRPDHAFVTKVLMARLNAMEPKTVGAALHPQKKSHG